MRTLCNDNQQTSIIWAEEFTGPNRARQSLNCPKSAGERIEGYYAPFYEEVIDINGKGTFLGSDLEDYDYGGDK